MSETTAIYARLSLDRNDGASVAIQLKDCRARVKREGWGPAREFVDNSISAFNGKERPQYLAMLSAVRSGQIQRVVAWHLDRLYRQPRELEDLIDLADAGRVALVTIQGEASLGTDDAITMARVTVAFANAESRRKSKRVKSAKQEARENGKGSGGPRPFGWKATWTINEAGKKRRTLTEDPLEATAIRKAVTDLLAGASLNDIAKRWNAEGVKQPQARSKNGWTPTGIRQLMSNPRLAGLVGHRAEKRNAAGKITAYARAKVVGVGKDWPVIIERPVWEELQAHLDQRGAGWHMPRRRSLLTGLVTCGWSGSDGVPCGAKMVRTGARGLNADKEPRKVWRCMPRPGQDLNTRPPHGITIDAAGLEALLTQATFLRADTMSLATIVRRQGKQGEQARELVRDLEELERRERELGESIAAGKLTVTVAQTASAAIERQKRALQARLGPMTSTAALEPYAGRRGILQQKWPGLTVDQKRSIIAAALGTVTILPGKPGRPSFDRKRVQIRPRKVEA